MDTKTNTFRKHLSANGKSYVYYDITSIPDIDETHLSRLPYCLKILLECALRNYDNKLINMEHIQRIASWPHRDEQNDIPFIPSRIVLQDFTGVPVVVDLAAMRTKLREMGGDANKINPIVPVDLVVDHSVMVDSFGSNESIDFNVRKEFERNSERYELLKWSQNSFSNFRVFPPSIGIVHQVNLEYLASVATIRKVNNEYLIFPDSLVGTDSHTTMINGIGVLGWGVGGIEAEACMLGHPLYFLMPEVVGVKLVNKLPEGTTATDLVLTITNMLRKQGVVGKFVEFYGEGVSNITVEDRATVSNMCPEYGATIAYFPIDKKTLDYLKATGRNREDVSLVEQYYRIQNMFRTDNSPNPIFTATLTLDLSTVEPSLAGPKRPQDLIKLKDMKSSFSHIMAMPVDKGGYGTDAQGMKKTVEIKYEDGETEILNTGSVVIAAITSCTNTSNPYVMVGAALLAKRAVELGLSKPRYVKSSFAPGSLVVREYLNRAGLLPYLNELGFNIVGYGCTTCIGNSGPLPDKVRQAIEENNMTVAAILSGNRNFEGRIHPLTKMNYLASPLLVVAYALAGTVNIDFAHEPIGFNSKNQPIYLKDLWPSEDEIKSIIDTFITPDIYVDTYRNIYSQNDLWNNLPVSKEGVYKWNQTSTYIKMPTFFDKTGIIPNKIVDISGAKVLALLGDSVTTDHISPAGSIPETSDAGNHLTSQNVKIEHYNSYGSRRGNHEIMMRGIFANIRIRNRLVPGIEGGFTKHLPSNETMSIFNAAMRYRDTCTPLVIIAGKEYGTGSSRDWAAKGTALLGVKAVIAESFERIHRSNLIGMGVLPLQFVYGINAESLGIMGNEDFNIKGISDNLYPNKELTICAISPDGNQICFNVIARLDNDIEVEYYAHGGILNMILRGCLDTKDKA